MQSILKFLMAVGWFALPHQSLAADLTLSTTLGDHMVLQRGGEGAVVWGFVAAGSKVGVSFAGVEYTAVSDSTGTWRVRLNPLVAGGPYTLTAGSGSTVVSLTDVLVGDVFL